MKEKVSTIGGYYSHNPLSPPYLKGETKGEPLYQGGIERESAYLKGETKGEPLS